MQYTIVGNEDGTQVVTLFVPGKSVQVAHSSHPNFDAIKAGLEANDENVIDLFDVAQSVAERFDKLTERVSVANGRMYLDGVEVSNALSTQVVRFLKEGVEDWKPLVAFFENVQANPNEHSREQLYGWLDSEEFTITEDGLIVGYKSVYSTDDGYKSTRGGRAIVNGVVHEGQIPQKDGDVVEMPRDEVNHDPSIGCHTGLHVGTYEYASTFTGNVLIEVRVNPRDVVSVPTDCSEQKMRVCRYTVVGTVEKKYDSALLYEVEVELDDFGWGDGEDITDDELLRLAEELGLDLDADDTEPVADLEEKPGDVFQSVQPGDIFETTDKRRAGTRFKVESIEGDEAIGKSLPSNLTRKVKVARLLSYRYTKVN